MPTDELSEAEDKRKAFYLTKNVKIKIGIFNTIIVIIQWNRNYNNYNENLQRWNTWYLHKCNVDVVKPHFECLLQNGIYWPNMISCERKYLESCTVILKSISLFGDFHREIKWNNHITHFFTRFELTKTCTLSGKLTNLKLHKFAEECVNFSVSRVSV